MADGPNLSDGQNKSSGFVNAVAWPFEVVGGKLLESLGHVGELFFLFLEALGWVVRALTSRKVRLGRSAIVSQLIRTGVRSIFIVSLVSGSVGLILTLQLAPPLDQFGQRALIANIISVAVLRELGPLIGAIVLTGFAGAAIAAEIGTMVVSEEIEALEAGALNPVRFLVVPRILATVMAMTGLGVISSFVSISASIGISTIILDIPFETYFSNMESQAKMVDFLTGLSKGTIFGGLIGIIACGNGLKVTGGAAGVGLATTRTVVQCVVAIVLADLVFTAIFFALDLV